MDDWTWYQELLFMIGLFAYIAWAWWYTLYCQSDDYWDYRDR